MINTNYVKQILVACPLLENDMSGQHIRFSDDGLLCYSIEETGKTIVKRYMDGSALWCYSFSLVCEGEHMSEEQCAQNRLNAKCLGDWCAVNATSRSLPMPDAGLQVSSLRVTGCENCAGVPENGTKEQLKIQCELIYYQKVRK